MKTRDKVQAKVPPPRRPAVDVGQPPEVKPHRGKQIARDLLKGLLFTLVVLTIKLYVEHTTFGKQLHLMTYTLLQLRLSSDSESKKVPVAVVDISDLEPASFNTGKWTRLATPREPLLKLINALARQGVKGIGVDIDFSPDQPGYMTPGDPEFFQACLDLRNRTNIPIFLGIHRSQDLEPRVWLGSEAYKDIAASITILRPDSTKMPTMKMPKWTKRDADAGPSPTLSAALAGVLQPSEAHPPEWLRWAIEQTSEKRLDDYKLTVGEFLVDYSPLETLKDKTLKTVNPTVIADQGRLLSNKIVLLGDGTFGKVADSFTIPGQPEPVPGVYVQACAIHTLTRPLYELTHAGRIAIDLILSVAIIVTIACIRLYYRDREIDTHRLQGFLTFMVVLGAYVIGFVFVLTTRVMWDDYILAITALLLHPSIERNIEMALKAMKGKLLPAFKRSFVK